MSSVSTILNSLGLVTRAARAGQVAVAPADVEALSGAVAALGAVAATDPQPIRGHIYGNDRPPIDRVERTIKLGGERAEIFALLAASRPDLAAWFAADQLSTDTLHDALPDKAWDSEGVQNAQPEMEALEQPADLVSSRPYQSDDPRVPGGVEVTLSIVDPDVWHAFDSAVDEAAMAIKEGGNPADTITQWFEEVDMSQALTYEMLEAALALAQQRFEYYESIYNPKGE